MCKRIVYLICLMCFVLVFGQAERALGADPNLVGLWRLDEGSGTTAHDSSGHGNDGIFNGDPQWVEGIYGSGIEFDGDGDFLDCGSDPSLDLTKWTIAFWLRLNENKNYNAYIVKGVDAAENYEVLTYGAGNFHFPIQFEDGARGFSNTDTGISIVDEWAHYTYTYDPAEGRRFYKDGSLIFEDTESGIPQASTDPLLIGNEGGQSRFVPGVMDDIGIFNYAMAVEEIQTIMQGYTPAELAVNLSPEDEQIDVPRDSILAWGAGKFANTHDVYFGTTLDDVNDASRANPSDILVSQGQADTTYNAGILGFGQTYYWRVDEVNAAPDNTVFKGAVWSFTAEPYAIPVEAITATASSSNADTMGPGNTINGIGLNELDQHSVEGKEMWLSGMGDLTPWIQYEFDKAYKLDEMLVWNSNQLIESFVGIGAKDVVIEYSTDGIDWLVLEGATELAQAPGAAGYEANTAVDFGGAMAQYIKITVNAGWGMLPQYGLSEVRFLSIPIFAREAQPENGGTSTGANVLLSWRAGREAAAHQVYLGTEAEALTLLGTTEDSNYDAGVLDYDTSYFWQIVEVNEAETPASHIGSIWSFATPAFGTVDNFDQYDDKCNRIFFAWADGLGHGGGEDIEDCDVPASNGNGGGSIVGNSMAPFAERTIVAAGSQSLPFSYDNAFGPSEATLTLGAEDWTASRVKSLALSFYGTEGNGGQLYVKINNSKVAYTGDAANIALAEWQSWVIDLATVGGNLENVTSLTIGVDGTSAAGMLYIDEIGLYP
jgi:hypothetical protein